MPSWLGHLAVHLGKLETQDIEWWRIGASMRLGLRMLVVGVAVGLATGLISVLIYGIEFSIRFGCVPGLEEAVLAAITGGLGVGLTFGLIHGFATKKLPVNGPKFEPSHMRPSFDDGFIKTWIQLRKRFWSSFVPRVGAGFLGGLVFGGLWACAQALIDLLYGYSGPLALLGAANALTVGVGVGAGVGLVATVGAALETVLPWKESVEPVNLLDTSRTTALTQLLAVALVIGVGYGLVFEFIFGAAAGIGAGLVAGLVVGLGVCTMTAWGRWVLLARVWLPLTGQAPRAMIDFLQDAHRRGVLRQAGAVY